MSEPRSERNVRIAAALIVAAGVAASSLAILAPALGIGPEVARGVFGWKRLGLLVAGVLVTVAGALLFARPQIVLSWTAMAQLNTALGAVTIRRSLWNVTYVSVEGVEVELDVPSPEGSHGLQQSATLRLRTNLEAQSAGAAARAVRFGEQVVALIEQANAESAEPRERRRYEEERIREGREPRPLGVLAREVARMPPFVLFATGLLAALAGTATVAPCSADVSCSGTRALGGSLLMVAGMQLVALGLFAAAYASHLRRRRHRPQSSTDSSTALREGFAIGGSALLVGLVMGTALTNEWVAGGIGALADTKLLGVLALALAMQLAISLGIALAASASVATIRQFRERKRASTLVWLGSYVPKPASIAALLTVFFVATSWWWLATDTRPPTNDAVRHLGLAQQNSALFRDGEMVEALTAWSAFAETPLLHLIGGLTMLFAGEGQVWPTLTANLIFVPLLALGTYKAGSLAWGDRRAGVLAVAFVLAAPMLISMFRVFMVDAPLAAMTALATWLILASDRFARRDYTVAAGVAVGAGVMTKIVFPFYVAGLLGVVLVRGGWRNWRNLAWVAVPIAVIATPWMVVNAADLWPHVRGHLEATQGWTYGDYQFPPRWSVEGFTYYSWHIVNHQLLVPLTALLVIGAVVATKDTIRGWRNRTNYAPELLAGLLGGYVLTSMLPLNDARYILPLVVYAGLLGTGWILRLTRRARIVAVTALAAILVVNTAVQNLRIIDDPVTVYLNQQGGEPPPNREGEFRVLSPGGFIFGPPDERAQTDDLIDAAKALGVRRASRLPGARGLFLRVDFNLAVAGLPPVRDLERLGPDEMAIRLWTPPTPPPEGEQPCTRWRYGGYAYYVYRGDARHLPADQYEPWCPLLHR